MTHRDYAQSVTFVTGHLKDGSMNLNWSQLAEPNQTVVFYMGLLGLPVITKQLMAHGVSPDMPVALVQQGTTEHQRVLPVLWRVFRRSWIAKPKPPADHRWRCCQAAGETAYKTPGTAAKGYRHRYAVRYLALTHMDIHETLCPPLGRQYLFSCFDGVLIKKQTRLKSQ